MNNLKIKTNELTAPMTTLEVGGPCKFYAEIKTKSELEEAIEFAEKNKAKALVLGEGSNLLISDNGFEGLIIKLINDDITTNSETTKKIKLDVVAGVKWDDFVKYAVNKDLWGIECLSGIPGTVGASAVQNIGAYGQQVSDVIKSVEYFDVAQKKFFKVKNKECGFSYRKSNFKNNPNKIVYSVEFVLSKTRNKKASTHAQIKNIAENKSALPSNIRKAVLAVRKAKSMVYDKKDPDSKSAGSFFTNPVITKETAQKLTKIYGEGVPLYENEGWGYKIAAAWLIEKSGFYKGFIYKDTGLSSKHTLAIINRNNCTAKEILEFSKTIQRAVKKKFDIDLTPEVVIVGF